MGQMSDVKDLLAQTKKPVLVFNRLNQVIDGMEMSVFKQLSKWARQNALSKRKENSGIREGNTGTNSVHDETESFKTTISLSDCRIYIRDARVVENSFAVFRITILYKDKYWHIWRRTSEFENLKTILATDFPHVNVPEIKYKFIELSNHFQALSASSSELSHKDKKTRRLQQQTQDADILSNQLLDLLKDCQMGLIDWLLGLRDTSILSDHSQVREFCGLPPFRYTNKFGQPLEKEQIAKLKQQYIQQVKDKQEESKKRTLPGTGTGQGVYRGNNVESFQVLDERPEAKKMYKAGGGKSFRVRGRSYMDDQIKIPAGPAICKLLLMELYEVEPQDGDRHDHVASRGAAKERVDAITSLPDHPFVLVLNFQIPGDPPVSLVCYFAVPSEISEPYQSATSKLDPDTLKVKRLFDKYCDLPATEQQRLALWGIGSTAPTNGSVTPNMTQPTLTSVSTSTSPATVVSASLVPVSIPADSQSLAKATPQSQGSSSSRPMSTTDGSKGSARANQSDATLRRVAPPCRPFPFPIPDLSPTRSKRVTAPSVQSPSQSQSTSNGHGDGDDVAEEESRHSLESSHDHTSKGPFRRFHLPWGFGHHKASSSTTSTSSTISTSEDGRQHQSAHGHRSLAPRLSILGDCLPIRGLTHTHTAVVDQSNHSGSGPDDIPTASSFARDAQGEGSSGVGSAAVSRGSSQDAVSSCLRTNDSNHGDAGSHRSDPSHNGHFADSSRHLDRDTELQQPAVNPEPHHTGGGGGGGGGGGVSSQSSWIKVPSDVRWPSPYEPGALPPNDFRNKRFKLIPVVTEGPWIVQAAVRAKPALLGQKVVQRYFRGARYMETDVHVGSSIIASQIVGVCRGYAKHFVCDVGLVLQGEHESELPERLLACVTINKIDTDVRRKL